MFIYNVGLKTLLQEGLSESEVYGDLVYIFRKSVGKTDFSVQLKKSVTRYKKIGDNTNIITKTCLYKFDPLQPHFFIVKLGFTGVYIIFLIFLNNIDCGYSLEPPRRGGVRTASPRRF